MQLSPAGPVQCMIVQMGCSSLACHLLNPYPSFILYESLPMSFAMNALATSQEVNQQCLQCNTSVTRASTSCRNTLGSPMW